MKSILLILSFLIVIVSQAQVTMLANIPKMIAPNSEFAFNVKINKGTILNFSKYQIDVPEGVILSEVETKTGSFSFENNRAKIIWVAIPDEAEFEVIFRITTGQLSGEGIFNQKFTFLENGAKKEVAAEPISVTFSAVAGASRINSNPLTAASSTPASIVTSSPTDSLLPVSQQKSAEKITPDMMPSTATLPSATAAKENQSDKSIEQLKEQFKNVNDEKPVKTANGTKQTSISSYDIVYKIQIGAYGENPGKAKYSSLTDVAIIKEGDFYKVLVGNFKGKEDALVRKTELLEKGFKGFIVSYQHGQRVK